MFPNGTFLWYVSVKAKRSVCRAGGELHLVNESCWHPGRDAGRFPARAWHSVSSIIWTGFKHKGLHEMGQSNLCMRQIYIYQVLCESFFSTLLLGECALEAVCSEQSWEKSSNPVPPLHCGVVRQFWRRKDVGGEAFWIYSTIWRAVLMEYTASLSSLDAVNHTNGDKGSHLLSLYNRGGMLTKLVKKA